MTTITNEQRRRIFGLARELGLTGDEGSANLHAIVYEVTGKESIKVLSSDQAEKVVKRLRSLLGRRRLTAQRPGRASEREIWKQRELAREIGWTEEQLLAFVKRMAKVDRLEWQDVDQSWRVIEGLKKIVSRQRKGVQQQHESSHG